MQVRLQTVTITEQDRRAIRFQNDKRKTMCSRKEAEAFLVLAIEKALRDLRYRWHGPQVDPAVLAGADPEGIASMDKPADEPAPDSPLAKGDTTAEAPEAVTVEATKEPATASA